jgi:flavin-dependent dehydrogenase
LAVVGGGPAGIFGAIRAKSICPSLNVLVLEKSQFLSKVFGLNFSKMFLHLVDRLELLLYIYHRHHAV